MTSDPDEATLWPRVAAAVRRRGPGRTPAAGERALLRQVGLRRLRGGSNALYALDGAAGPLCLKLYTATGEAGARREWSALLLLQRHRFPWAPAPLWLDADGGAAPAALLMERLAGRTIRHRRLTRPLLGALAETLAGMYAITRAAADDGTLPVVLHHDRLLRVLPEWLEGLDGTGAAALPPLEREALALARRWAAGPDPGWLRRPAPLVFSRTDANFRNCLWDGRRVAVVDYEHAGWKDRVLDLADLLEVEAATGIVFRRPRPRAAQADWAWFLERFGLSAEEHRRLLAAQRWLNWHFAFRNWPPRAGQIGGPAGRAPQAERFAAHVARARILLERGDG